MKVFVQRYAMQICDSRALSSKMLAEIDKKDLTGYLTYLNDILSRADAASVLATEPETLSDYFLAGPRRAGEMNYFKESFEPYLRRPIITVDCASTEGNAACAPLLTTTARETGELIRANGFSLWNGGNRSGLMRAVAVGFNDSVKQYGAADDQYQVQIVPASFVLPPDSSNRYYFDDDGLPKIRQRPSNEGLTHDSDATVIFSLFPLRREFLNKMPEAVIVLPGDSGTLEEAFGKVTANKACGMDTRIYFIDPYVPQLGHTFYHHQRLQIQDSIACGIGKQESYNNVHFVSSAHEAFDHLNRSLNNRNRLPEALYQSYCREHGAKPGVPLASRPHLAAECAALRL